MLAYELFLKNKNNRNRIVETLFPIKKLFYNDGFIKLDENGLDYYSSDKENNFAELQTLLLAPLNGSDAERINLPDKSRGGNSYHNFVKLQGIFEIQRKNNNIYDIKITLTTTKPPKNLGLKPFSATLKSHNKRDFKANGKIPLKLKMDDYFIGDQGQHLLDAYKNSKILDENLRLEAEVFKKICNTIFDLLNTNTSNFVPTRKINSNFEIYILPNESYITIKKNKEGKKFTDSFGN